MNCRSCGAPTEQVFTLGQTPLANSLLSVRTQECKTYPLDLMYCATCCLAQIRDIAQPEDMFREYYYYSKVQGTVVESARKLVNDIYKKYWRIFTFGDDPLVMELASNDGYLLQFYKEKGVPVLGVDPAVGPANEATRNGIPTLQKFFTLELAKTLPKADVLHANNVLAHVPNTNDFVAGIAEVLKPNGVCFIEVPYLGNLVQQGLFDLIYHEHVFSFSYRSLRMLLERHGLHIHNIETLPAHGGSIRVTASKNAMSTYFADVDLSGIQTLQERANNTACQLRSTVVDLKAQGKTVWGWGAAAKTAVMANYCGLTDNWITAVADDAPAKIGKFVPGTGLEIFHPDCWLEAQPDYTCVFAWNYLDDIVRRFAGQYKGTFFIPYNLPMEAVCES
jgi:SAM-dependent methyltransferase